MSNNSQAQSREWERDDTKPKKGNGIWVKLDGQLGYAKFDRIKEEWLGAKLAEIVGAPVPTAEHGSVRGNPAIISFVRTVDTVALSCCKNTEEDICVAFKRASGLIPFLAWIAAGDHGKPDNFVVTPDSDGLLEIQAIDFDNAFEWNVDFDFVPMIPELAQCSDSARLETVLTAIEGLSRESILETCKQAGILDAQAFAEQLVSRRDLLRDWLMKKDWARRL